MVYVYQYMCKMHDMLYNKWQQKVVVTSTCNVVELEDWDSLVDDPTCLFCSEIECSDHLFFKCAVAQQLWSMKLLRSMNIFCSAALWSSWSFRNELCFQEKCWSGVNVAALCTDSAPTEDFLQNLSIIPPGQKSSAPRQAWGRITVAAW